MASTWIIIYPRGNRSILSIAEICFGMEYEKDDYAIASRREFFDDRQGAVEYCIELAKENHLKTDLAEYGHHDYLD